jgi:hypothetical protein
MRKEFLRDWMEASQPEVAIAELTVLREKPGVRTAVEASVLECIRDHLAGLEIIARIGSHKKALAYIRNKLPVSKKVRSGDFGEILASEYIDQFTEFRVPIKRLRWKDDRNVAMRWNDVIAIRQSLRRWMLLKTESKSRAALAGATVKEAIDGLAKHAGRPNPSSLAFISARLREQGRDAEAEVFEGFQARRLNPDEVEHMVFTLSGNNPTEHLREYIGKDTRMVRRLVGCVLKDHQQFINAVFGSIHAGNSGRNCRST